MAQGVGIGLLPARVLMRHPLASQLRPIHLTSVLASLRGERDIAVGNVVGSNILNLLAVLGLTALITPQPIVVPASALAFDIPVLVAAAVACLPNFPSPDLCTAREVHLGYGSCIHRLPLLSGRPPMHS